MRIGAHIHWYLVDMSCRQEDWCRLSDNFVGRCNASSVAGIRPNIMFSMRTLLSSDPFLPHEVREALRGDRREARQQLVGLGVNDCEAAELLDVSQEEGCRTFCRGGDEAV